MRRIATATCIIGALALIGALIGQGVALAQGHHHNRGHHARAHHHVKKARHTDANSRLERLDPVTPVGSSTDQTPGTEKGAESAGKVVSFANGVLTLMLNDGSTVSGTVTSETRIKCASPTAKMADFGGQGSREDGSDDDDQGMGECSMSSLVPGALVADALLRISATGATFLQIELIVTPPTATEKSGSDDDEGGLGGEPEDD
jgi:hypothetical protein